MKQIQLPNQYVKMKKTVELGSLAFNPHEKFNKCND